MAVDLAEIEARLAAISPTPWCTDEHHPQFVYCDDALGSAVCDTFLHKYTANIPKTALANAAFIAKAPTDIALLLEMVKAYRTAFGDLARGVIQAAALSQSGSREARPEPLSADAIMELVNRYSDQCEALQEALDDDRPVFGPEYRKADATYAAIQKAVAQLIEDRERLDWLEAQDSVEISRGERTRHRVYLHGKGGYGFGQHSLREVIDHTKAHRDVREVLRLAGFDVEEETKLADAPTTGLPPGDRAE